MVCGAEASSSRGTWHYDVTLTGFRVSETFQQLAGLIRRGEVRISDHGYDELAADGIFARDVLGGVAEAIVVEDYPDYAKGPCVLVLQKDRSGEPMHVYGVFRKGHHPLRC